MAPSLESPQRTPRSKLVTSPSNSPSAHAINRFLRDLAIQLEIPDLNPFAAGNGPSAVGSDGAKCQSVISLLYFKDKPALDDCICRFKSFAQPEQHLKTLKVLLKVYRDEVVKSGAFRDSPGTSRRSNPTSLTSNTTANTRSFDTDSSRHIDSAATSLTTTSGGTDIETSFGPLNPHDSFRAPSPPPSPSPTTTTATRESKKRLSPPVARKQNGDIRKAFKQTGTRAAPGICLESEKRPQGKEDARSTDRRITCLFRQTKPPSLDVLSRTDAPSEKKPPKFNPPEKDVNIFAPAARPEPANKHEHWHTREMPQSQFFTEDIPESYHDSPLVLRFESMRYALYHRVVLQDLGKQFPLGTRDLKDVQTQLSHLGSNALGRSQYEKLKQPTWEQAHSSDWPPGLALTARLCFQSNKDPSALRLELKAPEMKQKSNRFFRKFGAHRFLRVTLPSTNVRDIPEHLDQKNFETALIKWLVTPGKHLLGCSWNAVFVKPGRATNKAKERFGEVDGREVFFFAEEGPGLDHITRKQMMNWFLDFSLNGGLSASKAYSRFELGFSSTIPTKVFKPSQVLEVPNAFSDGRPGHAALKDCSFDWRAIDDRNAEREMNDGCDMISAAAAAEVWSIMRGFGPVPSCFQARIGPYKGVWMVASPQHHGPVRPEDIWIRVNPTQTKFEKHKEDREDNNFDSLRLSFDVVTYSRPPKASTFYHEFIPILRDRGVPVDACSKIVLDSLETEKTAAEEALGHSVKALRWIQGRNAVLATTEGGTEFCGHREKTSSMMVQTLIQSGFKIEECARLNELMLSMIKKYLTANSNDLRITIPKSTSVIGVADPEKVLGPDEIHLHFSDSKTWGTSMLDNVDALVSRHPACRASDIQRVRIVQHPKLAHLCDIVVFPVTGCFPLAGKLQGGDYDGDTFWVCWQHDLVDQFRNAPPPAHSPHPQRFNIAVDSKTISHYQEWGQFDERFLRRNFELQLQQSLLGTCTNFLKRVRYTTNNMHHKGVLDLADIHDLLVDSSKNGYTFSEEKWSEWRKQNTAIRDVRDPLFDRAHNIKLDDDVTVKKFNTFTDIIDHLVFVIARPKCREILQTITNVARRFVKFEDKHLQQIWDRFFVRHELVDILKHLAKQLGFDSPFYEPWRNAGPRIQAAEHNGTATDDTKYESYTAARRECRLRFRDLQPLDLASGVSQIITHRSEQYGLSTWEKIKAAVLFQIWNEKPSFAFSIAGEILCRMKADSFEGTESLVARVGCDTKVRKRKFDEIDENEVEETTVVVEEVVSDEEQGYVTAYDGDGDTDMEQGPQIPTAPAIVGLDGASDAFENAAPGQIEWSGTTQYSWPSPPIGTPTQAMSPAKFETAPEEQYEFSQLSEGYSQLELME